MREIEKKLLRLIEGGLPLRADPFGVVGERLGLSAAEVVELVKKLQEENVIRRFGAVVNHFAVGYAANAMVVWKIGEEEIDGAGERIASFSFVSHCYRRQPAEEFPPNLYAMVHGADGGELEEKIERMEEAVGGRAYGVFHTLKEYKKTSLKVAELDEE